MNKKLILIMALIFVLSIGAGVGTMALYQRQIETNSNSVRSAKFNPVVKTRLPNASELNTWAGSHDFSISIIKPSINDGIGSFKVDTSKIDLDKNEYEITINGSINSDLKDSNVKFRVNEGYTTKGVFHANQANSPIIIEGDKEYTIYVFWPEPNDTQSLKWFRKNNDTNNVWLNKDENSNEYTNEDLYTWDAKYAGKTGEISLEVQVNQK